MKKMSVWVSCAVFSTLICSQVQAEVNSTDPTQTPAASPSATAPAPTTAAPEAVPVPAPVTAPATDSAAPVAPTSATPAPADSPTPSTVAPAVDQTPPGTQATQGISCETKMPMDKKITDDELANWSINAAQELFTLDSSMLDAQLKKMQNCFTDKGWKSYMDEMTKNKNLDEIKKQNYVLSSTKSEKGSVKANEPSNTNSWQVQLDPIDVVYQNSKIKINQTLKVTLFVSRKASGDLGIDRVMAIAVEQKVMEKPSTPVSTPAMPSTPDTSGQPAPSPVATPAEGSDGTAVTPAPAAP